MEIPTGYRLGNFLGLATHHQVYWTNGTFAESLDWEALRLGNFRGHYDSTQNIGCQNIGFTVTCSKIVFVPDSVKSLTLGGLAGHCLKHVRHDFRIGLQQKRDVWNKSFAPNLELFSPSWLSYDLLSIVHNELQYNRDMNELIWGYWRDQQIYNLVSSYLKSKAPHNTCSMKVCQNQQVYM